MEIRPILSSLLRNKTGALLIAAQVALSLAIVANSLYIIQDRIARTSRPSGVGDAAGAGGARDAVLDDVQRVGDDRQAQRHLGGDEERAGLVAQQRGEDGTDFHGVLLTGS